MILTISLLTKPLNFPSLRTEKNQSHADEAHTATCELHRPPARVVREEDTWSDFQPRPACNMCSSISEETYFLVSISSFTLERG